MTPALILSAPPRNGKPWWKARKGDTNDPELAEIIDPPTIEATVLIRNKRAANFDLERWVRRFGKEGRQYTIWVMTGDYRYEISLEADKTRWWFEREL